MGGDTSPERLFEAVRQATEAYDTVQFLILATPQVVSHLGKHPRVECCLTPDVVSMSDEPLAAVRHKKGSSLVTGIRLLKKRQIDAFVSAGNTGALIAAATLSLPLQPGIRRPALLANLPTEKGYVAVLDVGGNVSCKALHLVQFAQMGATYQRLSRGLARPRVGLLNVGVESQKGTKEVREAYQILKDQAASLAIDFVGNIEAREVMQGQVDVLVTDGFSGNVLLKSIEGASSFILRFLATHLEGQPEWLKELKAHFCSDEYPGAIVCGVKGVVVKCHGNASPRAFFQGIKGAVELAM